MRRVVGTGVAIGLFTFILHDMINFATFVPGTATTLFALLAFCVAERVHQESAEPAEVPNKPAARWAEVAAVAAAVTAVLVVAVIPVARAADYGKRASQLGRHVKADATRIEQADQMFRAAMAADPLDPTPCVEHARWWLALSADAALRDRAFETAAVSLVRATKRDPYAVSHRRMQIRFYQAMAKHTGRAGDYRAAIFAAHIAVALYPADPTGYVLLADSQLAAGEATGDAELLRDAIESYRRALAMDDARPEWERIRGFREREKKAIEEKISRAEGLLQSQP
jgi:tetratricopeptide (TPR) repeat protein